jgi:SAM-dependent methyltransferase
MASTSLDTSPFPATPYSPRYDKWPYNDSDFVRYDENDDGVFYRQPRLVTHIDDPSIARLTQYYDAALPKQGRIMDMCTSWKSFYSPSIKEAIQKGELEVFGVGLNAEEMALNGVFQGPDRWRVLDLNKPPHDARAGWERGQDLQFDAVTCVVSIDYLNKPLGVCKKLLEATKEGGKVHLVISNRCFPNKVVRRWMMLDERSRLEFVGDYLHFAGWKDVEIVDLCARDENGMRVTDDQGTVIVPSPRLPQHLDPLWVVRGTKRS